MTDELMYTIPLRETVAGEALSMLCGSNTTLHWGDMGMRSPLASVSVLLSSSTLFRFSIHMASTGPSRTIQICSPTTLDGEKFQYRHKPIRRIWFARCDSYQEGLKGMFQKFLKWRLRILSLCALTDFLYFFDFYATNDSVRFIRKNRSVITTISSSLWAQKV